MLFSRRKSALSSSSQSRQARRRRALDAAARPVFDALEDRTMFSFRTPVSYPTGASPRGVVSADFNRDGKLDLAVANYAGTVGSTVSVLLGNGDGTFQPKTDFAASAYAADCLCLARRHRNDSKVYLQCTAQSASQQRQDDPARDGRRQQKLAANAYAPDAPAPRISATLTHSR